MKKCLLLTLSLFLLTMNVWGGKVNPQQAQHKAESLAMELLNNKTFHGRRVNKSQIPSATQSYVAEDEVLYLFNIGEDEGFVIVSGDDRTESILGYADEGSFNMEEAPENVKAWLKGYERQIRWIQKHGVSLSSIPRRAPKATISPLLKTLWNQYAPYNLKLSFPEYFGNQLCLTGCVATAMAQIMYYHQLPTAACAAIPEYTLTFQDGSSRTFGALPAATFDWSAIKTSYSGNETDASAEAVATLMRYCGQSVEMNYGINGSGASTAMAAVALKQYYGYDEDVRSLSRDRYDAAEWDEMMYRELQNKRPVIYSGSTSDNFGHAFILDGYKDGKYHINWGWGDGWNGYFLLSVADPYNEELTDPTQGTEAYAYNQEAVIGIQKPDGIDEVDRRLTITEIGLYNDMDYVLSYKVENQCGISGNYDLAIGVIDVSGNVLRILTDLLADYPLPTNSWYGGGAMPMRSSSDHENLLLTIICKLSSASSYQPCIGWEDYIMIAKPEHMYGNAFTLVPKTNVSIATGIDSVEKDTPTPTYYLLNGMRGKKPGKGIVIVNGKKVVRGIVMKDE